MNPFVAISLFCLGFGGTEIVRTADGETLRGTVRRENGGAFVRVGAIERFFADDQIVWAAPEADLRREAERLVEGAGTGTAGATRHAQVALWCADHALDEEAYGSLERAAKLDPRAPAVARAVSGLGERLAARVEAGKPLDDLVEFAAGSSARRLVAENALGRFESEAARSALLRGLKSPRTPVRRFATSALGELFPGGAVEPLAACAVADTDDAVRGYAVASLRKAEGTSACQALTRHLFSAQNAVARRRAAEAIGKVGSPAGVPPLAAALRATQTASSAGGGGPRGYVFFGTQTTIVRDFDVEVAQAAAIGDPQIGVVSHGAVLDARVLAVRQERMVFLNALSSIVGRNLGDSPEAWEAWYREQPR